MRKRIEVVDDVLYDQVDAIREASGEKSIARTARRLLTERIAIVNSQASDGREGRDTEGQRIVTAQTGEGHSNSQR